MRCKNCGADNDDNRYICEVCGSPLYDESEMITIMIMIKKINIIINIIIKKITKAKRKIKVPKRKAS